MMPNMPPDGPVTLVEDANIRRVVFCSGKVYYDLFEEREKRGINDMYLLRVEQLYPFPLKALISSLARFKQARDLLVPGRAEKHGRLELRRSLISNGCSRRPAAKPSARFTRAGPPPRRRQPG